MNNPLLNPWIWAANILGWPIIHFLISYLFTNLPDKFFDHQHWIFKKFFWEFDGKLYEKFFKIKSWKSKLPDAASWFSGGFPKRKILSRDLPYLERFAGETCRGESAHIITMACCPVFFIWNPNWASIIMVVYAVASNLPCIITQRYNRILLTRLIAIKKKNLKDPHVQA